MLVKTYSSTVFGIEATTITIEVNLGIGINFYLVGLPDSAVKESHQRIKAAFKNNDLNFPGKEVTINMAPADIRKEGSVFDLPIAVGILAVSDQVLPVKLSDYQMIGELSLDGALNPMKGVLPVAIQAKKEGFKGLILPLQNAAEAAVVEGLDVIGVSDLREVVDFLNNDKDIQPFKVDILEQFGRMTDAFDVDFRDVKGQMNIKRAFEIAAAGGHNVIIISFFITTL